MTDNNYNTLPSSVIKFDPITKKVHSPILLLKTKSGKILGKIKYNNLRFSFVTQGLDEISFDIHKIVNAKTCDFWEEIRGLRIIDVVGYGQFIANFPINDEQEVIKTANCKSLEEELGQATIREMHINDEFAIIDGRPYIDANGISRNLDWTNEHPNDFIHTCLHNNSDENHSVLCRVLKEKAPHWSVGYVTEYVVVGNKVIKTDKAWHEFTIENTDIYSFFTKELSEFFNVVFTFDTYNRKVNCYCAEDYVYDLDSYTIIEGAYKIDGTFYDKNGNKLIGNYGYLDGIGQDTNIYLSKQKLLQNAQIETNIDDVKTCFYVSGGDDIITNGVASANITGNNYIYMIPDYLYEDMSDELETKLKSYWLMLENKKQEFNNLYSNLCRITDDLLLKRDSMFPDTSLKETNAELEYNSIFNYFKTNGIVILTSASEDSFANVTSIVKNVATSICDTRYKVELPSDSNEYKQSFVNNKWSGYIKITNIKDETDFVLKSIYTNVKKSSDTSDDMKYVQQKLMINIAKMSIADIDYDAYITYSPVNDQYIFNENGLINFFNQYNLNSLKGFCDAFESCKLTLISVKNNLEHDITKSLNGITSKYQKLFDICSSVYLSRKSEVEILETNQEQANSAIVQFRKQIDMKTYIGDDLWKEFHYYIREGEYSNSNYTSDALKTDEEIREKCESLLSVANKELSKACMIQKKVTNNLYNLFAVDELKEFRDKFCLYNYVRCNIDNHIYKLRLVKIDFSFDNPEKIEVTFSDNICSIDGMITDLQDIISSAQSIATTYDYTEKKASQGASSYNQFNKWKQEGLNSAEYLISNSPTQEMTIGFDGLLGRALLDESVYDKYQVRLLNGGLYLTDNSWETVSMAVGRGMYNGQWKFGVWADVLVGNIIAGENLIISNNKDGNLSTVIIDSNGLSMKEGYLYLENSSGSDSILIDPGAKKGTSNTIQVIKNSKNVLGFDGNILYIDGKITAKSGSIGGWDIAENALWYGNLSSYNYIKFDSTNKSIISQNGSNKCVLTSGYLFSTDGTYGSYLNSAALEFKKDNTYYARFSSTYWTGTTTRGVGINSYADSKFISFGNKTDNSQASFVTPLVLNYGLNPYKNKNNTSDGTTNKDVLIYGSTWHSGNIYFYDDSYISLSTTTYSGIYISNALKAPRIYAGNYVHGDYALDVNGKSYFSNDVRIKSKILFGDNNNGFWYTSDYNYVFTIGHFGVNGVAYSNHALAVTGSSYMNGDVIITGNAYLYTEYAGQTQNYQIIHGCNNVKSINMTTNANGTYLEIICNNPVGGAYAWGIYAWVSDTKLKKNINTTKVYALDKINDISFIEFDWKNNDSHVDLGVSANQLEEIIPEAVFEVEQENGVSIKNVNNPTMITYSLKAIQELYEIIKSQSERINELEKKINN